MKKINRNKKEQEAALAMPLKNVYLLLIGLAVIALGFLLLAGGGSDDPQVFRQEAMFSFRRMVIAPLLICGGFVFEIIAIMKVSKRKEDERV
jgi:membrane-bound ClpP family serine protease